MNRLAARHRCAQTTFVTPIRGPIGYERRDASDGSVTRRTLGLRQGKRIVATLTVLALFAVAGVELAAQAPAAPADSDRPTEVTSPQSSAASETPQPSSNDSVAGSRPTHHPSLEKLLRPVLDAHAGDVAVAIKHLNTGETYFYRADETMPTASLIKFPVLIEAYRQIHSRQLKLDQLVELSEDDKVPGSGVLTNHFSDGIQLPLRDAMQLMIAFSDNTATNLVVDQIGLPATGELMRDLGFPETRLNAKVYRRDTSIDPARSRRYGLGSTTAREMVRLFERLANGQLVSEAACGQMLEHLYACDDDTKLESELPPETRVAHKTGAVARSRCDAGLIDAPSGRIAMCVLTTNNEDQSWEPTNEANQLIGRIAKIAYDYFHPQPTGEGSLPDLVVGSQGKLVEALQRTLIARTQPPVSISVDGDFGPQTEQAVQQFQTQTGLPAHGRVDGATWDALGELIRSGPEVPSPEDIAQSEQQFEREPADTADGVPFVSCAAWAVADLRTGTLIGGHAVDERRHPASTTKMMTAVVALRVAQDNPQLWSGDVVFSERADKTVGSTAGLETGEIVTLAELLYGLLLPSGNDASVAIAEHIGQWLLDRDGEAGDAEQRFIDEMNETAKQLGMTRSSFRNPHGLPNDDHLTTAADLALLARYAMTFPRFREVVSTRRYGVRARSQQGYTRNVLWKNTNRLLGTAGYFGVKTGTTRAAGSCLVSCGDFDGRQLLAVVLGATSSPGRYVDTRNLFRWARLHAPTTDLQAVDTGRPIVVSTRARQLHDESLVVDGHNDLPWRMRNFRGLSFDRTDIAMPQPEMHTDIVRLREGGVGAQFWSVYVPFDTAERGVALRTTLEQIDFVHAMVEHYPHVFALCKTHADVVAARESGRLASLIGVEGGHSIENSLSVLRQLYARGARYMTLTHSGTLDWADSATDAARNQGLSPFGVAVVQEMNRLGMLVDLSHVSVDVMRQALDLTKAPVIFSHSSARQLASHPRNVPDEILRRLPENGGVVMVNFYSGFVRQPYVENRRRWDAMQQRMEADGASAEEIRAARQRWQQQHPLDRGTIYDVVDHIDHIARTAGIDHVGLGADYDGVDDLPTQLEDVSSYPRLTQILLDRGYTDQAIKKILGDNLLRVLKRAETVRDDLAGAE